MKNWRYTAVSSQGAAHKKANDPCQDACLVLERDDRLILLVADGAGSALYGGQGAQIVVESLGQQLQDTSVDSLTSREFLEQALTHCREHLLTRAKALNTSLKTLSSTTLGAIIFDACIIGFQIGDGAIVYASSDNDAFKMLTTPEQGRYPNETWFLTSDQWREHLQFCALEERARSVAAFSDGLQDLALETQNGFAPFQGFFNPFFQLLINEPSDEARVSQTESFLGSPRVSNRTSDDKTIVFASKYVDG